MVCDLPASIDMNDWNITGIQDVLVFAFASCPFCKEAKALLDAKGARCIFTYDPFSILPPTC